MKAAQTLALLAAFALFVGIAACAQSQADEPAEARAERALTSKTSAAIRAERRLFDGAPPTIPHSDFGGNCTSCHTEIGIEVPGTGYAPPAPHGAELKAGAMKRCPQCHVFASTAPVFRSNSFEGIQQDLRFGERLHDWSPPVIPHATWMRENCVACHSGPAAREEIRSDHPERIRCQQCHVSLLDTSAPLGTPAK